MEILTRMLAGRKMAIVWIAAVAAIVTLGIVRQSTEAEYAFASAAIIPVFLVTWAGGLRHGAAAAALAAGMWVVADLLSGADHHNDWTPVFNGLVRLVNYCFIAYLTARVRTLLQREIQLSTRDPLTGLRNRRAFLDAGNAEANRARRYAESIAVVFVDLDNFKKLNDSRGHDVGDAALQSVAHSIDEIPARHRHRSQARRRRIRHHLAGDQRRSGG